MNHPRCSDCQIEGTCVTEWTAHIAFCDWAKRGGAWLAKVVELSAKGPAPTLADQPSVQQLIADLRTVRACQYRSPCSCSGARCGLRNGEVVSHLVCLPCVRQYS